MNTTTMWLVYVLLLVLTPTLFAETGEDVNGVLTEIFAARGYNKNIRPIKDQTNAINISVTFILYSVIDFDEKTESIKTVGYLNVVWYDEYFTWQPESYNDTQYIFVPQDSIWKPDIALKNSYASFNGLGFSLLNVKIKSNGLVHWYPFQVFESTCSMTITYFPFDVQTCELKFSAWSYTQAEVVLLLGSDGILLNEYVPNALWEIAGTSTEQIRSSYEAAVKFKIKLRRKSRFYVFNIVIPVMFLSVLNVFSFVLPVVSGERAGYSITVFLSLAVFLTIVFDQLPKNSEDTSLMAVYLMSATCLSTVIVMICMFQLRIQSWYGTAKPITQFYQNFVIIHRFFRGSKCGKPTVRSKGENPSKLPSTSLQDVENEQPEIHPAVDKMVPQSEVTWLDVVNAMDFIFFTSSLLYTFVCTLVIGVIAINV